MSIVIEGSGATQIENLHYFPSSVYKIKLPQYLDTVRMVANENLQVLKKDSKLDDLYPAYQTMDIQGDERIFDFGNNAIQSAWGILNTQGYAMENYNTFYESIWVQEHHKSSNMEQHTHSGGIQLVGFYFLDVPENSSKLIVHDPRPAKLQIDLMEQNEADVTLASRAVNFAPEESDLYFTNAWLPHSFTRHGNDEPLRFVHINISVQKAKMLDFKPATVI
jgi:hypothetical protein